MKFLLALVTLLFVMRLSFAFTVPAFLAPVAGVSEDSHSQADGASNCKGMTPTPCGKGCCMWACCDPEKITCCF